MTVSVKWSHDALMADLAGSLFAMDRMVWQDLQLGPSGSPRPDVFTINKSFANPHQTAYECKISVSDFRSDVTSGKWIKYLEYAGAVIFAAPAGLVGKDDVPAHCGLTLRHENVWRLAKKPVRQPCVLPPEAALKLLIDGVERQGPISRARHWVGNDAFAKRYGAEAARWCSDAASVKSSVEHSRKTVETMLDGARKQVAKMIAEATTEAPRLWSDLLCVLELPQDADIWKVRGAIRKLGVERDGTEGERKLKQLHQALSRLVENFKPEEKPETASSLDVDSEADPVEAHADENL